METIKFSIAQYTGIGERPDVILLDRKKGEFSKQYNNVDDLKKALGENPIIYFVADKNNERISNLNGWNGNKFNFSELLNFM